MARKIRRSEVSPNEFLAFNGRQIKTSEFLKFMDAVFDCAKWFGIPTATEGIFFFWSIILFTGVVVIEVCAIWKVIRALSGTAIDMTGSRSVINRFSGTLFYGNALLSTLILWRIKSNWMKLEKFWSATENASSFSWKTYDLNVKKRMSMVTGGVVLCSLLEHIMSMVSATGVDIAPSEYFKIYILNSHGFLLRKWEFSYWTAIPIFVLSKTATTIWNFQDLFLILTSLGLTFRYKILNFYVEDVTLEAHLSKDFKKDMDPYSENWKWRKLRESYAQQATLVRKVDKVLRWLIPLSNFNNLYFILLQLFLGVGAGASTINKLYYIVSFSWLCLRACSVVLCAAEVNVQSKRALIHLHDCPQKNYNVEVQRLIKQLTNDYLALSGFGFFYLERSVLLKVAATVMTYELILLQYDK